MVKRFTETNLKAIAEKIAEVEKKTRGEIVVIVARRSGSYLPFQLFGGFVGMILATLLAVLFSRGESTWLTTVHLLECQLAGFLIGFTIFLSSGINRLFIPSSYLSSRVHLYCQAHFLDKGLHRTRDHTGILIYLSLFEHRVEILADKGIHDKASELWAKEVAHIIQGIRDDKAVEHLNEVIGEMGEHLSTHFPPREDDHNELTDRVYVL